MFILFRIFEYYVTEYFICIISSFFCITFRDDIFRALSLHSITTQYLPREYCNTLGEYLVPALPHCVRHRKGMVAKATPFVAGNSPHGNGSGTQGNTVGVVTTLVSNRLRHFINIK